MKILTLIRHAKSAWSSAAVTDFDRPLNARGKKAAPLMGQRLAINGCQPDQLVSSAARRARQTAKRIAKELAYPKDQISYCDNIYAASLSSLIEVIHNLAAENDTVILFGHNPGFSELGRWLSQEAPEWLPTCAVLTLELPVKSWQKVTNNCAKIVAYDYPKKTG